MADITRIQATLQDYLEQAESNQFVEFINGEIVMTPPPLEPHQSVSMHILAFLLKWLPASELRHAPTGLQLDDQNFVEPDIFWVSHENVGCALGEDGYWHGAPDLVIEILSPSTARRDKKDKFDLYQRYGVREYWLPDPVAEYLEVWRLEAGRFVPVGVFGPGDTFVSTVLNDQPVDVSALFG